MMVHNSNGDQNPVQAAAMQIASSNDMCNISKVLFTSLLSIIGGELPEQKEARRKHKDGSLGVPDQASLVILFYMVLIQAEIKQSHVINNKEKKNIHNSWYSGKSKSDGVVAAEGENPDLQTLFRRFWKVVAP
ncbi:hypothetical protein KIW84_072386 [Lathyrus oleraceus]|uniref:Uncharacterized protein n=1 Tax=Pisum sativum TaxID=3888 RepID=A0A9D4VMW1_PEA|nr:hypothetical protein KIW84_072386 [Pisum sativum]